eukprot:2068427-Pleurochrysis_carterae.AAC.2
MSLTVYSTCRRLAAPTTSFTCDKQWRYGDVLNCSPPRTPPLALALNRPSRARPEDLFMLAWTFPVKTQTPSLIRYPSNLRCMYDVPCSDTRRTAVSIKP